MVWANENTANKLHKIYILQKKAVRIICSMAYTAHSAPGFKILKLLTISDISKLQLAEFMYKYSNKLLPKTFQHLFTTNANIHSYGTRQACHYHLSSITTSLRKYSISTTGPKIWNALSKEIKSAASLHKFKNQLKSTYLGNYI